MNISDQAVEAAQRAVIDAMIEHGPDGHIDGYEEITRAALEAAAPHLMAQALDSAGARLDEFWNLRKDRDGHDWATGVEESEGIVRKLAAEYRSAGAGE